MALRGGGLREEIELNVIASRNTHQVLRQRTKIVQERAKTLDWVVVIRSFLEVLSLRPEKAGSGRDPLGKRDPLNHRRESGTSFNASSGRTNELPVILGSSLMMSGNRMPCSTDTAKISCTASSNLMNAITFPL